MIKLLIAFVFGVGLSITGWTAVENYSQEPEALGALSTFTSAQLATGASNGYILSTNGTANSWIVNSGGGGGGGSSLWAYTTATGVLSPIIASTSNHARITGSSFHATSTATSSVIALLDVTRLTNLTSDGFVKTGSGNGTLSIDTTTYESGLTAGDGLTRTANDFDFDGGTAPAGELGGTWASPTVDAEITTLEELSDVGTFTQATGDVIYWDGDSWENTATTTWDTNTTYTAGDGLTLTATDFDCDTASGSVFGCLSSANWTTFNDKADLSSAMTGTFDGNNFAGGAIATGDLLYGASAGSITELSIGSNGQILTIAGGLPAWVSTTTMPLGGDVTGTLSATVVGDDSHAHTGTTLSGIDLSDDVNLTAGDALTLTGDDIDFDGGTAPSGELGGTWGAITIDDSVAVSSWNLTTPTLTTSGTFFGESIDDFTGFGMALATGDLGLIVTGADDEECLTYEATGPTIEWATCGSGGGGALSTTTDNNPEVGEDISYITDDFYIGGSASNTAEFNFDVESASFTISSTSAAAAFLGLGTTSSPTSATLSIHAGAQTAPFFAIGSSTASLFTINAYGGITLSASQPATTTAITLDWNSAPQLVEYRIGGAATTITVINATTTANWGSRKVVTVCNPNGTAGALTWAGPRWIGTAPTQTTTANKCDVYSFIVTRATSSSAYTLAGTAGTGL